MCTWKLANVIIRPLLIAFEMSIMRRFWGLEGSKCHSYLQEDKKEDLGNYRLDRLTSVICEGDKAGTFKHAKDKNLPKFSQHGFTKETSHLIHLVAFYNEMTSSVAEGRAVDVVYLVFKIFDTASHDILLKKLVKFRLHKWGELLSSKDCD